MLFLPPSVEITYFCVEQNICSFSKVNVSWFNGLDLHLCSAARNKTILNNISCGCPTGASLKYSLKQKALGWIESTKSHSSNQPNANIGMRTDRQSHLKTLRPSYSLSLHLINKIICLKIPQSWHRQKGEGV